ncbi:hypothetical protein C8R45DRAFT_1128189 [Mycena sanguinolenta]|nr:hypothetical protein C8R45DRAFT_1128189 [Mycena sanguinolenta]
MYATSLIVLRASSGDGGWATSLGNGFVLAIGGRGMHIRIPEWRAGTEERRMQPWSRQAGDDNRASPLSRLSQTRLNHVGSSSLSTRRTKRPPPPAAADSTTPGDLILDSSTMLALPAISSIYSIPVTGKRLSTSPLALGQAPLGAVRAAWLLENPKRKPTERILISSSVHFLPLLPTLRVALPHPVPSFRFPRRSQENVEHPQAPTATEQAAELSQTRERETGVLLAGTPSSRARLATKPVDVSILFCPEREWERDGRERCRR